MLSCGSTKTNQSVLKGVDSAMVVEEPVVMNQRDSAIIPEAIDAAVPTCIKNKIDSFKLKEAHEKPQRVLQYKRINFIFYAFW